MKIEEFVQELNKLNINISEEQLSKLEEYYNYLIEYNNHTNLTTITRKEDVYLKHFYDSLTIVKSISFKDKAKILDIGSGAGFPGVVLKIIFPFLSVYLLDSNNKKTKFLEELCKRLELKDIEVINCRAEDYVKENRESFDYVFSRAVAKTRIIVELGVPFLKINGILIVMKASNEVTQDELNESQGALKLLNCSIQEVLRFNLPVENSERNLIVIKKDNSTDKIYPRPYDKIVKKPLK